MTTVIATVSSGGSFFPISAWPAGALYTTIDASNYTNYLEIDLFSPSIPSALGENLLNGSVVVPDNFLGLHARALVNPSTPTIPAITKNTTGKIMRNHDQGALWLTVNTSDGVYDWTALDAQVALAVSRGADYMFCFCGTPTWASSSPADSFYAGLGSRSPPTDMTDLGDFATLAAQRYKDRGTPIKYWQVWNEPKYSTVASSYFTGTAAELAQMAKTIKTSVKAVDSTYQVVGPCFTGMEATGAGSGNDYFNQFLSASDGSGTLGKDAIDSVSFNFYFYPSQSQSTRTYFGYPLGLKDVLTNVTDTMATNSISGKDVMITECSMLSTLSSYPLQFRVDFMKRVCWQAAALGINRLIWYAFNSQYGWQESDDEVNYAWNALVNEVCGSTITVANKLKSGQLALVVDGKNLLI